MQTRRQRWAQEAFQLIERCAKLEPKQKQEYRSLARSFPTLVHECGLAQAMAYLQNSDEKKAGRKLLLAHLQEMLQEMLSNQNLAENSRKAKLSEYILLSQRVMEASCWLKRYAEALISSDQEQ